MSDSSLNLIHGTFFEMLVCVSVSMRMLKFADFYTDADWVSVVLQFVFAVFLVGYIIFITYFTVMKTGLLKIKSTAEALEAKKEMVKNVHKGIIERQMSRKDSTMEKSVKMNDFYKQRRKENKNLIRRASTINERQFEKYEPLVQDLRKDSKLAMFSSFYINIRRCTLLYMAMFLTIEMGWLQVLIFMSQNLISTVFLLVVMPYEELFNNLLNIFNEVISLIIAYYITQNNDLRYEPH